MDGASPVVAEATPVASTSSTSHSHALLVTPAQVERALRISFVQAMIGAVFSASTGGMFLIGYALRLGADNFRIGVMTSVPMLCVFAQLISALMVERGGWSRRRITVLGVLSQASLWALIILIPYLAMNVSVNVRIAMLIVILTLVAFFGNLAVNARGGWIGDLIPAERRGFFFGRIGLYSGIVATVFAIGEGLFLDRVKGLGIAAFSTLFGFGMVFGIITALMFWPQADVPLVRHADGGGFLKGAREAFANVPLRRLAYCVLAWTAQGVAGPFYSTYVLRDLHLPFFGLAVANAMTMVTLLATSPLWGKVVDRFGSRPVLVACMIAMAPLPLTWLWIDRASRFYEFILPLNLFWGALTGGVSVAANTLIYRITPAAGRTVQLAVYSVAVTVLAAPFPMLGGSLPGALHWLGMTSADLRATFVAHAVVLALAGWMAMRLIDPGASRTRDMVRRMRARVWGGPAMVEGTVGR